MYVCIACILLHDKRRTTSTYRGRIEIGGVYLPSQLEHTPQLWTCRAPPASPGWANFSIVMEYTAESGHCYSVLCVICVQNYCVCTECLSTLRRKIIVYSKYQSVCSFVRIGSPHPLPPCECVTPLGPKGGGGHHSLTGDGVWGTQIERLDRKSCTLYTLCHTPSLFLGIQEEFISYHY